MFIFGSGTLCITPVGANVAANPTPMQVGVLQETQIDVSRDVKELYGQQSFPVAVASGKGKIALKSKFGRIDGKQINDAFFGASLTVGSRTAVSQNEGPTPIPSGLNITVGQSSMFTEDQGVNYTNGNMLTKIATGTPVAGQYKVSAGVYTFSAADNSAGLSVTITYAYTSATGVSSTLVNPTMGNQPYLTFDFAETYAQDGKQLYYRFFQGISAKLSLPTKNEDFAIHDFEASLFADPSTGNVWQINSSE